LQGLWAALVGFVLSVTAIVRLPIRLLLRALGKTKAVLLLVSVGLVAWLAIFK